jgi:hypothetical protein
LGRFTKAGRLRLHTPAALAELAVLARPTEIGKEAFPIDRLEDLLNPSSEAPEILWRFVEDLLEGGRFRFDQNVISDQSFGIPRAKTEFVHRVGVDQTVELILALRIGVALGRSLELRNDQIAFIIGLD